MTRRLYATKSPDGRYVTLGATPEEARALAAVMAMAVGELKKVRKWKVVPVTLTEGHGEG